MADSVTDSVTDSVSGPSGAEPESDGELRGRRPAPAARHPLLVQAVAPALVGVLLLLVSLPGPGLLVAGVVVVQALLVLGTLALVEAPASQGLFVLALSAAVVGDVLVLRADGEAGALAGVGAVGVVGTLALQLIRRSRERVTESLADGLLVLVVALSLGCLIALRDQDGGRAAVAVALVAGGACLLAGRLGDLVLARPELAAGSTRGWPGLLLGLGSGVAAAAIAATVTDQGDALQGTRAALLGLAVAATVAAADLAVDLGAAELKATRRDARRASAVGPVAMLLPYAALAPVALLAGRFVLP